MVEVEGTLNTKPVFILIDPGASLSYVSPRIVEICELQQKEFQNPWLVQLATGTKRKVTNFVKECEFFMNDFKTQVDLNILPLGSYDLLIGMDWLKKHSIILNCYDKTFSCLDNEGNKVIVKGIPRKVSVLEISALQMNKFVRKGYKVFAVHILDNSNENGNADIENIPILNEYKDVFPEEIPGLPPK